MPGKQAPQQSAPHYAVFYKACGYFQLKATDGSSFRYITGSLCFRYVPVARS